ncbi:hypothetical protein AB0F81_23375 [Actinoplanes sp. NPDC024001]|uniref:hypothetical protein n=1 Tax=Actinoplanes sp. NPDC024001 TaxID=3154598 RepID=UPI0033CED157
MTFGYKIGWLAVPRRAPEEVAAAIGLSEPARVGWAEGVDGAYDAALFVCPPVAGWTLVAGTTLLEASMTPAWGTWLARLSEPLGEVQYFGTHRVIEYQAWWRARAGRLVRAFTFLGESGEVLANLGEQTAEEADLGLPYVDPAMSTDAFWDLPGLVLPDESHVLALAGRWSIDPTALDEPAGPGEGLLGRLPHVTR